MKRYVNCAVENEVYRSEYCVKRYVNCAVEILLFNSNIKCVLLFFECVCAYVSV